MSLIDKLLCSHKFQIYHTGVDRPNIFATFKTPVTYLKCTECGKIRKVNNYCLMEHADFYYEQCRRLDIKGYDDYRISIHPFDNEAYGYDGYVAYKLLQEVFLFNDKYSPIQKEVDLMGYYNKDI